MKIEKLEEIRAKAIAGDVKAQLKLGWAYRYSPQNDQEAAKWITKACMYELGIGVIQNYQEAFKWYLKAAKRGLRCAQEQIASMYFNGIGVTKNDEEAKFWLFIAGYGS